MLIVVVMGGIYSGMFTPTEAAAMSAVYAFFIAVFVYKDLSFKQIPRVLLDSANMSAMLLFIIASAVLFSFILTSEQIPQRMADAIVASGMGPIGFLIVVNLLLLVAGALMEPSSIILILAPDPVPGGGGARHRSDPLRRDDRGEHGDRHDHAAGGPEPVRGERHHQGRPHRVSRAAGRWRSALSPAQPASPRGLCHVRVRSRVPDALHAPPARGRR
jgi:hypothetical protein